MSKEQIYHAIVLKKQPLNEADEIVTFFTQEAGKVRGLAKSVKLSKSKLQHSLQSLFFLQVTLAGSRQAGLKKIIKTRILETFPHIRENLQSTKVIFYALELLLKGTADEHKNPKLFQLFLDFLSFCNKDGLQKDLTEMTLLKFKISFLENIGLAIREPKGDQSQRLFFSNFKGGFVFGSQAADAVPVDREVYLLFNSLKNKEFARLPAGNPKHLQKLITKFLEYQLEREIKAKHYLNEGM
ncbi:MAG: DNA repair protein RecO [Candidatus Doudnabacteria bacterium]|nr:DNA repair protein RecO [Candidatus Doudnabacteria bacterium]